MPDFSFFSDPSLTSLPPAFVGSVPAAAAAVVAEVRSFDPLDPV